jgi:hypothetical protein
MLFASRIFSCVCIGLVFRYLREFSSIFLKRKVHYRVHKSRPQAYNLSQIDPGHTIPSCLSKIYFNNDDNNNNINNLCLNAFWLSFPYQYFFQTVHQVVCGFLCLTNRVTKENCGSFIQFFVCHFCVQSTHVINNGSFRTSY